MMELRRAYRKGQRRARVRDHNRRAMKNECEQNFRRNQHCKKALRRYFEKHKYRRYKTRTAPEDFSVIDNSEKVIEFINNLRKVTVR